MKKIILMMFLMSSFIFAANDALVFYVDTPDMVDMYFLIFSAIGRIFSSGDYVSLLRLVFLVGGVMVFVGGIFKSFGTGSGEGAISGYLKYLILGVALLTLVFWNGHTPILIKAKYFTTTCDTNAPSETMGVAVPDGVPTLVAYGYYFTNQIGYVLTDLAVKSYSTVYNDPYQGMNKNNGYMGALKGAMRVMAIDPNKISLRAKDNNGTSLTPYDYGKVYKSLFTDCILVPFSGKGDAGEEQLAKLKSSSNLTSYLNDLYGGNGVDIGGTNSRNFSLNYQGEIMNCGQFYDTVVQPIATRYASEVSCGMPVGLGAVSLITGAGSDPMSDFSEVAIQAGLVSQLEESSSKLGIGVSGVSYASGKTRAEFIQSSLASGQYMSEMLPFLQMTIRAILYAFFPFVFVIVLLPGGIKVLGNYVQSLIWVELWSPTAAILDLFMSANAQREISDIYGGQGMTMMSSIDMLSAGSTIAGVAGYLYMSVPALTWLILKGSAQMLQGIGSAAAAGMSRNITTESINRDAGQLAKRREASEKAGKDISMAEMQHYEAVQSGRLEGAALGLQMKAGMDTMTDKAASKEQEEISEYVRSANATGVGGASHGDAKGAKRAVKTVTDIKTGAKVSSGKKNLTTVAKDAAEVDSRNETGSMKGKSDLKEDLTEDVYTNIEKDKQIQGLSQSDILNKYGVDGMHQHYVDKTSLSVDETKVTAGYGTMLGKNKVFDAKKTNAANKEAERLGAGPEKQGKAKGFNDAKTTYKIETEREELAKENMGATEAGKVEGTAAAENTFKLKEYQDQLSTLTPAQRAIAAVRPDIVNTANNFLKKANGISIGDEVRAKLSDDMSTINGKNEFLNNGGTTDQRTKVVKTNIETETGKADVKQAIAKEQGISVQEMEMNRESFGNSTYRLGEDGKTILKETHDSNGNVTHTEKMAANLTEFKEIPREAVKNLAENTAIDKINEKYEKYGENHTKEEVKAEMARNQKKDREFVHLAGESAQKLYDTLKDTNKAVKSVNIKSIVAATALNNVDEKQINDVQEILQNISGDIQNENNQGISNENKKFPGNNGKNGHSGR